MLKKGKRFRWGIEGAKGCRDLGQIFAFKTDRIKGPGGLGDFSERFRVWRIPDNLIFRIGEFDAVCLKLHRALCGEVDRVACEIGRPEAPRFVSRDFCNKVNAFNDQWRVRRIGRG